MKDQSLTNFNVPIITRTRFDEICELSGRTRTSVLVDLMERHIIEQGKVLESRNRQIEKVDNTLRKSRRIMSFKEFLRSNPQTNRIGRQRGVKPDVSQGMIPRPDPEITPSKNWWWNIDYIISLGNLMKNMLILKPDDPLSFGLIRLTPVMSETSWVRGRYVDW